MAIKPGFSFIELIVVIGLLSLLMLAISSTMLMTIVSSNRIRTTTKVKQAGNYALGQIQSMLRSAKTVTLCDSGNAIITFTSPDGGSTTLATESDGTNARIASGSGVYLTPASTTATSYTLTCEPDDATPSLVKLSFDLQDIQTTRRASENPLLHFETSINLRNE